MPRTAIIGAGAAGCFCASILRESGADVTLFEAHRKPMEKLAVTGGGRCNLTNSFEGISSLKEAYPRGESVLKRVLKAFSQEDTCLWFTRRGVPLVLQDDHCWFPASQDAMDIVRVLARGIEGATVKLQHRVQAIEAAGQGFTVDGEPFDFVVVTAGGQPGGIPFLKSLSLEMVPPVPSLFTFTVPDPALRSLMGLVVQAGVSLPGTAFKADGPLLVTDWGLSGPAALKLSSYAARYLADKSYRADIAINWLSSGESTVREQLQKTAAENPRKQVSTTHGTLPARLWEHLVRRAGLREDLRWAEMGSKGLNRLTATLTCDVYPVSGKSRFREEFVTAGGVALSNIQLSTLESKAYPGLYFAGEILDIDAITGGFNLQAAWSTGYVAAQSILKKMPRV